MDRQVLHHSGPPLKTTKVTNHPAPNKVGQVTKEKRYSCRQYQATQHFNSCEVEVSNINTSLDKDNNTPTTTVSRDKRACIRATGTDAGAAGGQEERVAAEVTAYRPNPQLRLAQVQVIAVPPHKSPQASLHTALLPAVFPQTGLITGLPNKSFQPPNLLTEGQTASHSQNHYSEGRRGEGR